MPCQLNDDCINEIFKYFNKNTLYSCLFISRHWSEKAVSLLWRNIWDYSIHDKPSHVVIISTLISCLSNKSKARLSEYGIFITTPTSKSPFFQYAALCKVISIHKMDLMIQNFLESQRSITSTNSDFKKYYLILREMVTMFMTQVTSLKGLEFDSTENFNVDVPVPRAKNFLKFPTYRLFRTFHNIQTLTIKVEKPDDMNWIKIIPLLMNYSSSLTELYLGLFSVNVPISFIGEFKNLQKLVLEFTSDELDDFFLLQHVKFQHLKVLKFLCKCPKVELLIQFLKNNGTNLKELYLESDDDSLNLFIARFCPNLKNSKLRKRF